MFSNFAFNQGAPSDIINPNDIVTINQSSSSALNNEAESKSIYAASRLKEEPSDSRQIGGRLDESTFVLDTKTCQAIVDETPEQSNNRGGKGMNPNHEGLTTLSTGSLQPDVTLLENYQSIFEATLLRRYKRFLVDLSTPALSNGLSESRPSQGKIGESWATTVGYCPNTGSMAGLLDKLPTRAIFSNCLPSHSSASSSSTPSPLSPSTTPFRIPSSTKASSSSTRKYPIALEAIRVDDVWVGIHSALANRLTESALEKGFLDPIFHGPFSKIQREVSIPAHNEYSLREFWNRNCPWLEDSKAPSKGLGGEDESAEIDIQVTKKPKRGSKAREEKKVIAKSNDLASTVPGLSSSIALSSRTSFASAPSSSSSRVDFVLWRSDRRGAIFLEVKSVTMSGKRTDGGRRGDEEIQNGKNQKTIGLFPDTVSDRARKHVEELHHLHIMAAEKFGSNDPISPADPRITCACLFVIQRGDCEGFSPSWIRDPKFSEALKKAETAGVAIAAMRVVLDLKEEGSISKQPPLVGMKGIEDERSRKPATHTDVGSEKAICHSKRNRGENSCSTIEDGSEPKRNHLCYKFNGFVDVSFQH
eukprot:CAMPEP_0175084340 /NCGR_PEP_ID=MMETSP0052_2-20121109/27989_1 /TAXON_ID=51329 ORGANISM="Polytomella parva, Strain SAG 63-3" /NCGR_SAMPLE_ID=MMETSP0052_2 /ASSEMBLY_ACC=CAM_ASM_000194 /LENGTH=588 /DNA_ID=CAMNT_0016356101 /DNA_START=107 /DNA_END=1873 /DNA_ORIENTATION=-